ncbi:hypothetical protein Pla175_02820 [Pirellulimonas nuda]|uniref:Uncharacterized protein n=1 Tax=Pirellulimonas nuda TaxID=2528009 RepID=A0A518D628_9BACT|nr:hypothetical protein Pla175_02820 [Pirellulimonas nuda]
MKMTNDQAPMTSARWVPGVEAKRSPQAFAIESLR